MSFLATCLHTSPQRLLWHLQQLLTLLGQPHNVDMLIGPLARHMRQLQAVVSPFKLPSSLLHAAEVPQSPSYVPASPEAAWTAKPSSHLLAAHKPPRSTTLNPAKFVQRCSQQPSVPVNQHQHSPILNQSKPVGDQSRPASSLLSPARPGVHSASQMTSPPHSRAKMLPHPSPLGRTTGPASCEALDSAVGQQTAPPMPSPAPVLPAEHTAAVCATSHAASALTDAQRQTSFAAADEDDALVAVDRNRKKSKKNRRHKTRDRPEDVPKRRKKDKTGKKDISAKKGTEAKIEQ